MKKCIAIVGLVAAVAFQARADISIDWNGAIGFYNYDVVGTPADPGDYCNFGGQVDTAYLIYSTNSTIEFNSANVAGQYAGADEYVLDSYGPNAALYGDYSNGPELYTGSLEGGYVFVRMIDTSAPGGGVQYYDSAPLLTVAYNPLLPLSQSLDHNSGDPLGDQMTLVPEPSTLAFLGLGGLMMAIRRRKTA